MSRIKSAPYNVYIDESRLDSLAAVTADLRSAGMQVEQIAETLGVVSGSIPDDRVERIRQVRGVEFVAPDRDVYLPEALSEG